MHRQTKMLLLVTPLLMQGCQSGQEKTDFCDIAKPIYLDKADKLTPDTARQVLIYNDTGHALCGWSYAK